MEKTIFNQSSTRTWALSSFLSILLLVLFSSFSNQNNEIYSKEKIYIHFDKPNYYIGEDIWFKTYLLKAETHTPETVSKIVYVELIDPDNKIIEMKTVKIKDGGGEGNFELSPKLISGEYTVRAYTNFMRNFDSAYFFRKKLFIKNLKNGATTDNAYDPVTIDGPKPDIQFFPEGGYLVNGFLNRVGFKAIDANGKGINIEGTITDNTGTRILELKSSKFGMGMFEFTPEQNNSYKLNILRHGVKLTYDLPTALKQGVVMQIREHGEDFRVTLESSLNGGLSNFSLVCKQRKGVVFSAELVDNESKAVIKIPESVLEQGIVQFTLFDDENNPLSERLSFYETDTENINLNITPSKQEYGTRELVKLEIDLVSFLDKKAQANMSIAVTDMLAVESDPFALDIKSQLLLNSELKGTIEKPGYYFYSDDPERKKNQDVLMMTQGWRKYIINDTLSNPSKPTFLAETGIGISGKVKNFFNHKKSAVAEVSLTYKNSEEFAHETITTDVNGHFMFKNLDFSDSTSVIIQAKKTKSIKQSKRAKNPNMNFHIELDSFINPKITLNQKKHLKGVTKKISSKYLEPMLKLQKGTIKLDEVVVEKDVLELDEYHKKRRESLLKYPSHTVDFKDIKGVPPTDWLEALIGRVPGYNPNTGYLRGALGPPLYLLDGIPIDDADGISISDIDFVDVIHRSRATVYGVRGGNGIIAIYTFDGSKKPRTTEDYKRKGVVNFKHPGYTTKKFYEPVYKTQKEDTKLDYRSTIYWNPKIGLNEQNKASISFYTSDAKSPYRIIVEGISFDGKIIRSEAYLNLAKD